MGLYGSTEVLLELIEPNEPLRPPVDVHISEAEVKEARTGQGAEVGSFVMVAEDDGAFRWLLSETLRNAGFGVLTAEDGIEALRLFRENAGTVWLVIADIFMPGMDGLTAAIEMRKIDDKVFFIFMSGYDSERIDRIGIRMEDIPRSDFFRKPFAFRDMTSRIRTLQRSRE
jgi:DNA-binding response OmpR family regulator